MGKNVNATEIQRALIGHLQLSGTHILMPNVFVGEWESDVVRVTKAGYWTEYEIKVSISDYKRDMAKQLGRRGPKKHEIYCTGGTIIPKQFYFVVPFGMINEVPEHCGLIEYDPGGRCWGIKVKKVAPVLKNHSKLNSKDIFKLAVKASLRLWQKGL